MEHVVNVNYRGQMNKKAVILQSMKFENSKLHNKPQQLVVKDSQGTIIFFNSGKFRVMGCLDPLDAAFLALKYTLQIDEDDLPELKTQSYTSRFNLGYQINLQKLSAALKDDILYEPELFCALRMCKYRPLSVNVFSSGSIVVCRLKEPEDMYPIISEIDNLCKKLLL